MASTIQQVFERPARRPTKTRRPQRGGRFRFESLEPRSMLAITGLPDPGDQLGFPIVLGTDGTGPNALSVTLDDSSGTLVATLTANTAGGTVTRSYFNFNRSITFAGSFDADGSEVNAVTLTAPFGVALASNPADFYQWISTCDFAGGDVTVVTDNADSLTVKTPAGGAAGAAPSSIDGIFTSPTLTPSPGTPGADIAFETNSTVTLGDTRAVQAYNLSIQGVNNGTKSVVDLQDAVTVANDLEFLDSNAISIGENVTSTAGSISITSTAGGVTVTETVAAATGNVTIAASADLDVSGAKGLTVGPVSGTLSLSSTQGAVLLNTATPLPLVAGGAVTVTSAADLAVGVDVTSTNGNVTLQSTKGGLTLTKTVAAPAGSVTLSAAEDLDLTGAVGVNVGAANGSLTLTSTLGTVLLNPALPVTAGRNVTITAAEALAVGVDVTSTNGDVVLTSTNGGLTLTSTVTAANGSVTLAADKDLDLTAAVGLASGTTTGSLTLTSTQGKVLLKTAAPAIDLVAFGNVTVISAQELKVEVTVTANTGNVVLRSTGDSLRVFSPVTATLGTVTLGGGALGTVQINEPVAAGTGITSTSGGTFDLNNSLTTTNGPISVTVTGVGSTVDLGGATGLTAGGFAGAITLDSQQGGLVLKSGLPLVADQNITLRADVDFELTVPVTSRFGNVTLKSTGGDLDISETVTVLTGNLVLEAAGSIDDGAGGTIGILLVAGTTSVTAGTGQDITLDNATGPGHDFTGAVTVVRGANVKLADRDDIVLGGVTIGGTLTVNAVGITQVGAITQAAGAAGATFDAGAGALTLTNPGNDFVGPVSLFNDVTAAFAVAIRDVNGIELGTSNVGAGTLAVTAGGAITQAGPIVQAAGAGKATFDAGANSITLNDPGNQFTGPVSLLNSGTNDVEITNSVALDLGASSVGSGKFMVTAAGITQSGTITQAGAGAATFAAGANAITLTLPGNDFQGSVSLNNTGANAVAITNKGSLDLGESSVGTGTLAVTAAGITQSGVITQEPGAGSATFSAGANAITLTAANEFTGAVSLNNAGKFDVAVVDATDIELGASSVGTGTLTVTAVGITQSGAIIQALGAGQATFDGGVGVIALTSGNEFRGSVSLNNQGPNDVAVVDVSAIDLAASILGSGKLTVTAIGITQSGAITQEVGADAATFNAGAGAITLTNLANEFTGAVSLNNSGPNAVAVVDQTAIELGTSNVGRGTLTVTAVGITQSGPITQAIGASTATFNGGAGEILLTDGGNEFRGPVSLNNTGGNPVAVVDATAIDLAASSVGTGTLSVTAVGITQSGPITQAAGAGAATFDGDTGVIALTNVDNEFTGPVSLVSTGAANVTVTDKTAIELGASNVGTGTLTVNAQGITQSGAIVQAAGAGAATFNADANAITLTHFGNDFKGPVSLNNTGANNVAITDANDIVLGTSNVGTGTLTVTAVGITQVGPVVQAKDAGAVILAGGAGPITLTDPANDFTGPVTVTSADDVTLQDVSDLAFGGKSVVGGDLVVFAAGSITDGAAGTLTVAGTADLTAAGDILLDNVSDFQGDVTVTSGGDVSLNDMDDVTVVGPSVAQGDFDLAAGGAISLSGLTAAGDVTVATTVGDLTVADVTSTAAGISFQSLAGDVVVTGQLSAQAGTMVLTAWGELRGAAPLDPIDAQIVAQTLNATARDGNGVGAKLVFTNKANLVDTVSLDLVTDGGAPAGTEVSYIDADSFTVNSVICAAGPVTLESVAGGIAVNGDIGAAFGETLTGVTLTALDVISITGTVLAAAGPVAIQTTKGSVQVAGSLQSSPTHAITVDAGDSIIITGNVASGLTVTLTSGNLVNLGDVTATTAVSSITGDVLVDAQGAVTVTLADVAAPLGSVRMITLDTMSFDDGSLIANLDYTNGAPVVGLVRLEAPNGIDVVNSPLVRAGRLEIIGGGGGSVTLNDTLNDVDTIEIETGGDFIYYQVLVPLAIDDPDDLGNATLQVQSTGGSVSITSLAGLRVVDGISYNTTLSLIGRETGDDPGVEFFVTSAVDNPSPPAAPPPLAFAGTLRDMINYVNANTAQSTTGVGNAAMRVVFDDALVDPVTGEPLRSPAKVTLDETLPQIVKTITFDGVRIDGTLVEIDGAAIPTALANGLSLGAGSSGSVIENAYVYGFTGAAVASTSGKNVFRGLTLGDDADPAVDPVGNGIGLLLSGSQAVRNIVGIQNVGDLGNTFIANGIGLSITGGANFTTVRGNGIFDSVRDGIAITQSLGTVIGSDANPLLANQIADNGRHGIYLENVQGTSVAYGATIQGNEITGHDAGSGVRITGGGRNLVGGTITAAGNQITNNVDGVRIESSILPTPSNNNQVYGNTFTDNTETGVHIQGGFANIVSGNTIATSGIAGVRIAGASTNKTRSTNFVVNNSVSNSGSQQNDGGIVVVNSKGQVIGVDSRGVVLGNTVTGNRGSGIVIAGNSTHTLNSVIGNTVTGSGFDGIRVSGAVASTVRSNTSSGNVRAGIVVADAQSTATTPNLVTRNESSANAVGIQVTGSKATQVGGILVADANYVHSNTGDGIRVDASVSAGASKATALRNNVVGVTPGSVPAGNGGYGISISESTGTVVDYANTVRNNTAGGILVTGGAGTMIGSAVAGRANWIAANVGTGVTVQESARPAQRQVTVTVAGNLIEANGGDGVFVTGARANSVTIGQAPSITKPNGTGNVIRDNTGAGIRVNAANGVTMIGNSIYDNDDNARPIVLENGANAAAVIPSPTAVAIRRGNAKAPQWDIRGSIGGGPTDRFYVDIYMDVIGGGQAFMGRVLVQGGRSFRVVLRGPANGIGASGIRATATTAGGGVVGSTSEFSAAWA